MLLLLIFYFVLFFKFCLIAFKFIDVICNAIDKPSLPVEWKCVTKVLVTTKILTKAGHRVRKHWFSRDRISPWKLGFNDISNGLEKKNKGAISGFLKFIILLHNLKSLQYWLHMNEDIY